MLNNIISLVKDKVGDMIGGDKELPQDKKGEVVETTTTSIIDSLKDYATPDNISSLTSMLGIGGGARSEDSDDIRSSGITQGIQSNVISNLMSQVGLSQSKASGIAAMVVPAIMALFAQKANDGNEPGFNIGSLVSAFTGSKGSTAYGEGESVMDKIGSFFGK